MEKKVCLECQEPIKGRIDKKFCSDYCRNTYNNSVAKDSKNLIRNINNRLKRNYKILSELNVQGVPVLKAETKYEFLCIDSSLMDLGTWEPVSVPSSVFI